MNLKHAPAKVLMLYVTEDCNLRCTYCFVEKKPRRMTAEMAEKAVRFFFSRHISGSEYELSINFFGGEPFIEVERMEQVIALSRRQARQVCKKVAFSATTNGSVATPRVEKMVRDAAMHLLISLDGGPAANAHRPFVSGRASYDVVARNLPHLVSWAPVTVVRATFHPQALNLVENVRHLRELGAPSIALCPVEEANWNGHEDALEDAYAALAEEYIREARCGRILPLVITQQLLMRRHLAGDARPERPCGVGTGLLAVDPEGHVMPCHRFINRRHDWLGTVDNLHLSDARQRYIHLSSSRLLGCDGCAARPLCGGGCRAVAVSAGYDLDTGTHPGYCLTMRAHARAVETIYSTLMSEQTPAFVQALRHPMQWVAGLTELIER